VQPTRFVQNGEKCKAGLGVAGWETRTSQGAGPKTDRRPRPRFPDPAACRPRPKREATLAGPGGTPTNLYRTGPQTSPRRRRSVMDQRLQRAPPKRGISVWQGNLGCPKAQWACRFRINLRPGANGCAQFCRRQRLALGNTGRTGPEKPPERPWDGKAGSRRSLALRPMFLKTGAPGRSDHFLKHQGYP